MTHYPTAWKRTVRTALDQISQRLDDLDAALRQRFTQTRPQNPLDTKRLRYGRVAWLWDDGSCLKPRTTPMRRNATDTSP